MVKATVAEQLRQYLADLIEEGKDVLSTVQPKHHRLVHANVDHYRFFRWDAKCRNLVSVLGKHAEPWRPLLLRDKRHVLPAAEKLLATLQAIEDTLQAGLLVHVEDLIRADAFADLLERADYLLSESYHVSAGALGRAVLEEHLRNWCDRAGCMPSKERPTLADYNAALYRGKHLDKLTMKHVEGLIVIGNAAAHVEANLKTEDVQRLLRDVREFLSQHPLS
jgi:hypothetical protein